MKSINFHLWQPCNFRCKFCFDTLMDVKKDILPKGHLPLAEAKKLILLLSRNGFEKISFCGGEPTLCPWLLELLILSKQIGLRTSLITNGWKLLDTNYTQFIFPWLDEITLSIDSFSDETNIEIGRAFVGKKVISKEKYIHLSKEIKKSNIPYSKINSVICQWNHKEKMAPIIQEITPNRWKIIKSVSMEGQNDIHKNEFSITEKQFNYFINHNSFDSSHTLITTRKDVTQNRKYFLMDPAGRFFDDSLGLHIYSPSVLETGINNALNELNKKVNNLKQINRIHISPKIEHRA